MGDLALCVLVTLREFLVKTQDLAHVPPSCSFGCRISTGAVESREPLTACQEQHPGHGDALSLFSTEVTFWGFHFVSHTQMVPSRGGWLPSYKQSPTASTRIPNLEKGRPSSSDFEEHLSRQVATLRIRRCWNHAMPL